MLNPRPCFLADQPLNAIVYIDYENLRRNLEPYGLKPFQLLFFRRLQDHFVRLGLNITNFIAFGKFSKNSSGNKIQNHLNTLGVQTRDILKYGKVNPYLGLLIHVLQDLREHPGIDVVVIISSDRRIIPLIRAIRHFHKQIRLVLSQNNFNPVLTRHADVYEYLEAILNLAQPRVAKGPWKIKTKNRFALAAAGEKIAGDTYGRFTKSEETDGGIVQNAVDEGKSPSPVPQELTGFNAVVSMDYENMLELLKFYNRNLQGKDLIECIHDWLRKLRLNVVSFIAYGNFDQGMPDDWFQTFNIQTRNCFHYGKNCSDLALTVDVLRDLYKNPGIDIFVILSSDRDMIPLLKTIRFENKRSCLISSRIDINPDILKYADYHEYIEDLLNLTPPDTTPIQSQPVRVRLWDKITIPDPESVQGLKQVPFNLDLEYAMNFFKGDDRTIIMADND